MLVDSKKFPLTSYVLLQVMFLLTMFRHKLYICSCHSLLYHMLQEMSLSFPLCVEAGQELLSDQARYSSYILMRLNPERYMLALPLFPHNREPIIQAPSYRWGQVRHKLNKLFP